MRFALLVMVVMIGAACSGRSSRYSHSPADASLDGNGGSSGTGVDGDSGAPEGGPGTDAATVAAARSVDKVDLLFVIDNSNSMREEQAALSAQFERIVGALTSGQLPDGTTFPAVTDLHLGVVSTDMGLPGVPTREALGCSEDSVKPLGDDGVLQHSPNLAAAPSQGCPGDYSTPFLSFAVSGVPPIDELAASQLAPQLACIAALGTTGCGFEQQLESGLRALWPSNNLIHGREPVPPLALERPFIDGERFGQGEPAGANAGFLRNDISTGLSLLVVVHLSDEDDCSSHDMHHFFAPESLPDDDPLTSVAFGLRCFNESLVAGSEDARDQGMGGLYSTSRYATALKALRSGNENLAIFAAIVGVPPDLVSQEQVTAVDFGDDNARDAFYDRLLADDRMMETPRPPSPLDGSSAFLVPSCSRVISPIGASTQTALPPRRFVKVAREFGENAIIQSICTDDFTPAADQLLRLIAKRLQETFN